MTAYYNENDAFAADWLEALIAAGELPAGVVDRRSIEEVQPDDLRGFQHCHFFAGIGGWALAARLAGWPDERELWTGSCPCQPFSVAGAGTGTEDPRHLWPEFARLIAFRRPATVVGEQVASKAGRAWGAGVRADLEVLEYAVGLADLCAAGVGAPHIRQRQWWVAYADGGQPRKAGSERVQPGGEHRLQPEGSRADGWLADSNRTGRGEQPERDSESKAGREAAQHRDDPDGRGDVRGLGDTERARLEGHAGHGDRGHESRRDEALSAGSAAAAGGDRGLRHANGEREGAQSGVPEGARAVTRRGGPWDDAVLIPCGDGKSRRIEPGLAPLVDGLQRSLGRCRDAETEAFREVLAYAEASKTDAREVLRMVWHYVRAEACRGSARTGVRVELHEAEVLFPFLLSLRAACAESVNASGVQETSKSVHWRALRSLRCSRRLVHASHRRRSDEQRLGQFADALPELSWVLARHAQTYRAAAEDADAATGRVGRVRGYGNAIVPEEAEVVLAALMDVREAA